MMPTLVALSLWENMDFDLDAEIEKFQAAREAHKFTVDQPAPTANSALVEAIVLNGGVYALIDDSPPKPPPDPPLTRQIPQASPMSAPPQIPPHPPDARGRGPRMIQTLGILGQ